MAVGLHGAASDGKMDPSDKSADAQSGDLRRALRDMVALSTLPAIWAAKSPAEIGQSLAEVLVKVLSVDVVYMRLPVHRNGCVTEAVASSARPEAALSASAAGKLFEPWLAAGGSGTLRVPNPFGDGQLSIAVARFGHTGQYGNLVAGSSRADFPTETERLLLSVATNQAAVILQSKQAEERVRRSERALEDFFENATLGLHWVGPDGIIVRVNRAELDLLGYSREEYVGRHIAEFHVDEAVIKDMLRRLKAGEDLREYEARMRCKDGSIREVVVNSNVMWEDGRFVHTRCFTRDVTDRKRTEQALRQSRLALEEADRRKDEFLATLAHELRNPLAPICNSLEVMKRAGDDATLSERCRSTIERQVAQLVRLVDDLLDVSRITSNRLELRKERVELARVIEGAVETSRPLIDAMGHELTVRLPLRPIHVDADVTRLAQVFANLLNNAAKYTERGGRISVTAACEGNALVVRVADTGFGISEDVLPRIFDMFTQADDTMRRSQGGLGVGLTLAKRLVEMHGGEISARSEGPGKGSEFIVRLPLAEQPAAAPAPATSGPAVGASRRVLIVDDNADSARSLEILLGLAGHIVRSAHDGAEALVAAAEFRPDVILLDIGLPEIDGYEVARRIRSEPWAGKTMLVALTGWGQDSDRERSRDAGFDHHLVKPADLGLLTSLLASG
ncbi:MAG TPA: ATP-binding protein [Burkholderiales bacterium]|nr:ATP-binding protein [Burkholderiales bacterium]